MSLNRWKLSGAAVAVGVGVIAIAVGLRTVLVPSRGATAGPPAYRGHRLLIWAVEKADHEPKGFDDQVIRPGQLVTLSPVEGYRVRVEAGPVEKVTVTDFRKEWEEDHVPFKISNGTGSASGTKHLASPFLVVEYGTNEPVASALFAVPLETPAYTSLAAILTRESLTGTAALEDLLLATTEGPISNDFVRPADVLEVYRLLGKSQRTDRWFTRLERKRDGGGNLAAAVLMTLGEVKGADAYCAACLATTGNEQIGLIEILGDMPPSPRALETLVKLIASTRVYLLRSAPGVGIADMDRRYRLILNLKKNYPVEAVRRYSVELRAWAGSEFGRAHGGRQVEELLQAP